MADVGNDSTFDITAEVIDSTPIEKCSLNPRRGRNSRRLLTGFIIYASEVRKEVVEQYPDQNFGFISKLVGDKWRALATDVRFKYHQRALIHNKRIKELAAREGVPLGDVDLATGSVIKTPKSTKKIKSAKLSKHEKRLAKSMTSSTPTGKSSSRHSSETQKGTPSSSNNSSMMDASFDVAPVPNQHHQNHVTSSKPQDHATITTAANATNHTTTTTTTTATTTRKKTKTIDTSTQTIPIRFVDPPPKKPLTYSDAFLKRLKELQQQQQQLVK